MSEIEHFNFERKLALHTAPTLLGIKCAGLFSLSAGEFDVPANVACFNSKALAKNLKIRVLRGGARPLVLVYNENLIKKRLREPGICSLLKRYGYLEFSLEYCLNKLSEKFRTSENFPHEIGIFLGYPLEDVIGFIENKGDNFKLCGCWKVYGDEIAAKRSFANYEKCRNFLCNKLNEGTDLYRVLKIS